METALPNGCLYDRQLARFVAFGTVPDFESAPAHAARKLRADHARSCQGAGLPGGDFSHFSF